MGLDISFNREQALEAGIEVVTETRGSSSEVAQAIEDGQSQDYIHWLSTYATYVRVPGMVNEDGTPFFVEDNGVDEFVLRANQWGRTYAPLTAWLKANAITWEEF